MFQRFVTPDDLPLLALQLFLIVNAKLITVPVMILMKGSLALDSG